MCHHTHCTAFHLRGTGRTWRLEGEGEPLKKEGEWAIKLKQFGQGNARDLIGGVHRL
jgi:hypothetical protein